MGDGKLHGDCTITGLVAKIIDPDILRGIEADVCEEKDSHAGTVTISGNVYRWTV